MSKFKVNDKVAVISGCMKNKVGTITSIDDIIETGLTWCKVKLELDEPIYYLECELERIN